MKLSAFTLVIVGFFVALCFAEPITFTNEEGCNRAGGMCVYAAHCPNKIEEKYVGLCPLQRAKGAECCHGISTQETTCKGRGGECMLTCPSNLRDNYAKDCKENSYCCILI